MVATERRTQSEQQREPEILDVNGFGGLYGRFLLASQTPESEVSTIINPDDNKQSEPSIATISKIITDKRDYNPITQKLSTSERQEAWKGIEFEKAYESWKKQVTEAINKTTDEKRAETIKAISGKSALDFNESDADKLYIDFCKGKSDTTTFANSVVSTFKTDGNVDLAKIADLSSDIQWFAKNLFGKETAVAVSKIIQLEAEMTNNPNKVVRKIFADKQRVNELKPAEKEILKSLYGGLSAGKTEAESKEDEVVDYSSLIGHTIQYQGKKHTIRDFKDNRIHIVSERGSRRTMAIGELEKKLGKVGSKWKIFDKDGVPVSFKANETKDEDIDPAPWDQVDN